MRKNVGKVAIVVSLILAFAFYLGSKETKTSAQAQLNHNVTGAAWSSNIGWINFSCDTDPLGCTGPGGNYGVDLDPNSGSIFGQAWNSNIGWISFDNLANCPSGSCLPEYDPSTGSLKGWMKATAPNPANDGGCPTSDPGNEGCWDGWISLSGNPASGPYGAKFASGTGQGSGAAWGSDVVGWVDFSGVKLNVNPPAVNLSVSPNYSLCTNPPSTITLSWVTADVTSCVTSSNPANSEWDTFSLTIPPASGAKAVNALSTFPQTYFLDCTGPGGSTGLMPVSVTCGTAPVLTCGSANGSTFFSAPTTNLCNDGSVIPSVSGGASGPWSWTCGTNSCNATYGTPTPPPPKKPRFEEI